MTPPKLAPRLQSLPPILHKSIQKSMPSYSKGARGLSVQSRVAGIFTCTTNSLSVSLRQRPTRYAIHAGQNFNFVNLTFVRDQTISSSCLKQLGVSPFRTFFFLIHSYDMLFRVYRANDPDSDVSIVKSHHKFLQIIRNLVF